MTASIMAYAYSEGPATGVTADIVATSTIAVIEESSPVTTTYARPIVPTLFTTQLSAWTTTLSLEAPAGVYACSYDAVTQRVTIESTNATAFRPVMSGNAAVWLGFSQTLAGYALTWTGESAPAAVAELVGAMVQPAEDAARVDLERYRHGRAVAVAWGNHQTHRVRLVFARSTALDAIAAGYLTTGRVRVWQCGDLTAYSPTNIDGYIDGYVIAADDPIESGDVGELWTLDLVVGVAR